MYNKNNVDYVALLWEDFMSQADNREISSARKEHMPYLRFIEVIINHFISKDKTISMRNKINLHTIRDDSLLATLTKARKYKNVASPSRKLSHVLEEEPAEKPKRARKPAKKSTTVPTAGVVIKDTPCESMPKKKTPAKFDRGKCMDLIFDATLLEAAQVKEALKKRKKESRILHLSGSGDGVGSQPKVTDESEDKTIGTYEGTSTKPGVPDVPKYLSESENESWGDSCDDDSNEVTKNDDEDDVGSDANEDKEASDSEKTNSDEDENLNVNLNDDEEEEHEEEYVRTPDSFEFNDDDEEYEELYKDVNVRSKVAEHEEVGKRDAEMIDTTHESSKQSSSVSSDFASKFLNLDNVPPVINEVASMMNVKTPHEESSTQARLNLSVPVTAIPKTSTVLVTTVTPIIQPFSSISQMTAPTPVPTTEPSTSLIPALPDFAFIFEFDQRVSALEKELSQVKQVDHSVQILAQIPKAQAEKEKYIEIIEKSMKEIIKDEVKSQLPQILPKEVSDFATPVIQSAINKSLKNVIIAKSSSQPKSTYEAATSLTEFELKKILLDKIQKSKPYRGAPEHRQLYDALIKSYKLDKDLFESYGNTYSLKRDRDDKDQDEDPPARSDQWLKKRRTSKDVEPSRSSKSKESKSSSSKCSKSQSKSSGKSAQAEEPESFKNDWFKNLEKPLTPDRDWNARKQIDFRPPQTWISKMAKAVTNKLDWTNHEGHEYSFDLSKPIPLIEDQGRQVVPPNYFFNNDLEYLKAKKYDYGYLDEITIQREDYPIYKFIDGDFLRLNMRDIEDMLLLLVQKKFSNLERDDLFDLNVALWMFTSEFSFLSRVIHDIASSLEMDYLPKRRWGKLDRKRCRIMIKAIGQQLFERRLMRNMEKFVGGR
uniref:Uncharacterized protein n=1 Tax=Tanacetum cinerariifolium TaxID=118510 RepID=A0A6L2MAD6_TANCI|nr:hypothetical protein [Tanacetum cinerariifolium]